MTLDQAIRRADTLKPNQYETAEKVRWLSELDGKLFSETMRWHDGAPGGLSGLRMGDCDPPYGTPLGENGEWRGYDPDTDMNTALLAPDAYADVYVKFIMAQIDYHNNEIARYNNSMVMFNMAYATFADWYNRTHKPGQDHYVRTSL